LAAGYREGVPKRTNLFQKVVAIIHRHLASGDAEVEESAILVDRRTDQEREVDVAITQRVAGHEAVVSVEATAAGRKATVQWVEQQVAKHADLPTAVLVLVAEAGFAETARARAEALGAKPIEPEDLTDSDPAFVVVNRLRTVFPKVVELQPTKARVFFERPNGRREFFWVPPPITDDLMIYLENGEEFDYFHAVLHAALNAHWDKFNEQLGVANVATSTERNVTITMPGWVVDRDDGGSVRLCLRYDEAKPPELHRILAAEIRGRVKIDVAQIDLTHKRIGSAMTSFGQTSFGDRAALLVVTEDESGGKATLQLGDQEVRIEGTADLQLEDPKDGTSVST
jgi:hypothetical protein